MNPKSIILLLFLSILLTACQLAVPAPTEADTEAESLAIIAATATPQSESDAVDTEPNPDADDAQPTDEQANSVAAEPVAEDIHPAEQLITAFTEPSQTNGDVLILYGQVLDVNEAPLSNAVIEIWQTDAAGVYDHPRDPGTNSRDTTFQFYGMTTTNAEGWYAFRTIVPGRYEPRPRHIHYKVKQTGNTLLTSQFYFSDDIAEVQGEGMFRAVGASGDLLLLQLVQGDGLLLANGRIVVDMGIGSGTLPLTPRQAEGPYYPVVDLASIDNDLVRLP